MRTVMRVCCAVVLAATVAGCGSGIAGHGGPVDPTATTVPTTGAAVSTTVVAPVTSKAQAPAGVPAAFVDNWTRHVTAFVIRADGTGHATQRTYTPCGTSPDCAFQSDLKVVPGTGPDTVLITYVRVSYLGDNDAVMQLSAADHTQLDPYFPLAGEQATAIVDAGGRLVVTPLGRLEPPPGTPPSDGDTYCGRSTKPGQTEPCGA
ncbi:hypothetical protein [Pseudonocardia sp. GCM10023141]|uniref:hypothetical protein n=1 Tax=Pseudonocardia sp. GCM10023141 TaxID=3252653 RepID=UPI003606455E